MRLDRASLTDLSQLLSASSTVVIAGNADQFAPSEAGEVWLAAEERAELAVRAVREAFAVVQEIMPVS